MRILVALLLVFAAAAPAQDATDSAADVEAGSRIFRDNCAICHGLDGRGGRGSDLTRANYRHGDSDEDVFRVILRGVPGTEMPPFYTEGRQMWQIIGYLRSLQRRSGPAAAPLADVAQGRAIVTGKGGCLTCHSLNGSGGHSGPDLHSVAKSLSPEEIRQALLDPQASVLPEFWRITAKTRDGKLIEGRRLNEDTYSVQVLDNKGVLRSVRRGEVASLALSEKSIMPSFAGKLTDSEIEAVVAYLGIF